MVAGLLPRLASDVVGDPAAAKAAPVAAEVDPSPDRGPGRGADASPDAPPETPPAGSPAPPERPGKRGTVYLTFDDGPDPRWTPQVLDVLRRHGVHAVFFEVGQNVAAYPDLVARVRAEGHLIGNHTWSHAKLTDLRSRAIRDQLDRTDAALGGRARCVRPPYGATDPRVADVIGARGQRTVLWDVDPEDWAKPGTDRIVRRVLAQVHDGALVLMHDGGGDRSQTVAALEQVITRLQERGYGFGLLDC
ncbi:polysaccharide deacetylase [Nocardioides aromaticivorans]|uniref:Polysaccharide deacetylase n=2 Tax=Nocardioides aromaticivorans TaxID=200618 RepID=A0ABX7PRP5_9ACTN|nr:polysaccharide deacetylase [Nocardioides aromaticivorans]